MFPERIFTGIQQKVSVYINENEMMQIDEVINQDCQEAKKEMQVAP